MNDIKASLTAARLRELVTYDPATGIFLWRVRTGTASAGAVCGTVAYGSSGRYGRRQIAIDRTIYYAHRLAWLYMTGEWPANVIDHIDGDATNNAWSNLRSTSQLANSQNMRRAQVNSKSGLLGASKHSCGKWIARISIRRKDMYLGLFETPEEAHAAYLSAKRQFHEGNTL